MTTDMLMKYFGEEHNCYVFKVNGWATKEKRDINLNELKTVCKACLKIESHIKEKTTSFPIDNPTMVA